MNQPLSFKLPIQTHPDLDGLMQTVNVTYDISLHTVDMSIYIYITTVCSLSFPAPLINTIEASIECAIES